MITPVAVLAENKLTIQRVPKGLGGATSPPPALPLAVGAGSGSGLAAWAETSLVLSI